MTSTSRGPRLLGAVDGLIGRVTQIAGHLSALVCALLILTTTFSVVVYQRGITIAWLDDVLRMLLIWLVYLGSVSLCFRNDHVAMDAVYERMPAPLRRFIDLIVGLLGVVLCAYVAKYGFDSVSREIEFGALLPSGYLPAWPQTLAIPLCFALMSVAYISFLYFVLTGTKKQRISESAGSLKT
ncbi:MAG: TRAP transporter small permease subunit [Rhizobiales bacterium]|nr:TRAP transporter small permease subunit [Hyphomicrobiales bacterium]